LARKELVVEEVAKLMNSPDQIRNIGIVAHVDHGKTTLSDSLVARAGLISKELAGEQRVLDYDEQEQARGITIKSANISLGFKYDGKDYLINMIDTPGHVDFGGHVTRAMRAVDGVVLVVDCVEGIMPQTETVLRQALKERVRPVLFVNKIDRLINELKLSPDQMQQKFMKVITGINKLIDNYGPPEFKEEWTIKVDKGNVAFGTGFHKWALSFPIMQKTGLTFKDLYELCEGEKHKELAQKAPIDDVILRMVITRLPSPKKAQKYRIPVIWHGDEEGKYGKAMINCDPNGKATFMVTAIQVDEHAGDVAVGRIYSGKLKKGIDLYLGSQFKTEKMQGVAVYMGPDRLPVEEATPGNIVAVVGLKDVYAGETLSEGEMAPFEKIKHNAEPVVTKSIEAKNPRDLAKLIEVLHKISKEDPTLKVTINQDTGEHLISGMGELHLEIIEYKIKNERGVDIQTGPPIVVYLETITGNGPELEGKSPNKHNKFKIFVEPLEEGVKQAFIDGKIDSKMKGKELSERLVEAGLPRNEAKKILFIEENNLFVDATKGVQYLQDIRELVVQAFKEAMVLGPLSREKCTGVKVKLTDASIHVDPAHRGPTQIVPAIRNPIYASMLEAGTVLLEPKVNLFVSTPGEFMSGAINQIQGRRGQVVNIEQEGEAVSIHANVPVSALFGFASEIRGATQGRATWYHEYAGYEKLPSGLQEQIAKEIRKRKGLSEVLPTASTYMG
jgi:elongation factor 2